MATETFPADSDMGRKVQENAQTMIELVTKRGVEMANEGTIPAENVIGAAYMVWRAADELLDFDLDSEREGFEDSCRMMCATTIELMALPVEEKTN